MKLNVPYFKQEDKNGCFSASVRMILASYGIEKPEAEINKESWKHLGEPDDAGMAVYISSLGLKWISYLGYMGQEYEDPKKKETKK